MGLLIFQRKEEGWFCQITEEWAVETIDEASKLMAYLMDNMIRFNVFYSFETIHIVMENSIYKQVDFEQFMIVINKLMEYKKENGDIKDIFQLEIPKKKSLNGGK